MKELFFGLIAAAAVGGGVYYTAASGGYDMSAKEAKAKLMAANAKVENGPFFGIDGMEVNVTSPSDNVVRWAASEDGHPRKSCEAIIKPVSDSEVEVTASCQSSMHSASGQGAVLADMAQADITEFVDAALTGRPYNPKRKMEAGTGSVAKNMGSMVGEAFKTKRDIEAMSREHAAASAQESASYNDDVVGEVESPADYEGYEAETAE
jgi:hypothetical protein